jgi:hypothetical protein
MGRTDHICINQFSLLHETTNSVPVLFSKTDWLHNDFRAIAEWGNPCVVICGNSDYCIGNAYHPYGEKLADIVPENVIRVFCQNCLVKKDHPNYDKFVILPIGIENYLECKRGGCGFVPSNAIEKHNLLSTIDTSVSSVSDQLYSNFMLRQNCQSREHRELVKKISIESLHIKWQEPTLTTEQFYREVLNHEATICAQGNGPGDNHRIYEVLYLNRIPITFNGEIYDRLHKNFPVVYLEQAEMLYDKSHMSALIRQAQNMDWDREMLHMPYWLNVVSEKSKL